MREVSIRLLAIPSNHRFDQQPWYRASLIDLQPDTDQFDGPFTVLGVYVNGVPQRHAMAGPTTVVVKPLIPLEGNRVEVRCAVQGSIEVPKVSGPRNPPAMSALSYGLQTAESHRRREARQ